MIKLDSFMLWRFCTTDGILDNIESFNLNETVFSNGSIIRYDPNNETVEIENHNSLFSSRETMTFRECTKEKLLSMGFKERTINRHTQSYCNFGFKFEK